MPSKTGPVSHLKDHDLTVDGYSLSPFREYRVFIDPRLSPGPALPSPFAVSEDPDRAELFVFDRGAPRDLRRRAHRDALRPVVVLGGGGGDELAVPNPRLDTLDPVLDRASAIVDRLRELRSVRPAAEITDPASKLLAFAWTRSSRIVASFSASLTRGFGYAAAQVLVADPDDPPPDPVTQLNGMAAAGYLAAELRDVAHACPACGSINVLLRDGCPACGSVDIRDETLIHHFACGFQAEESRFAVDFGIYVCPKCRRELRHFGLDYDKPGIIHRCNACGLQTSELEARGRCLACDATFAAEDGGRYSIHDYVLTAEGIDALFSGVLQTDAVSELIGRNLPLLPQGYAAVMVQKLAAIAERHDLTALVMTIDLNPIRRLPEGAGMQARFFVRVGAELAQLLRATDAVTYHMGKVTLLLPGADRERGERVEHRLRTALSAVFDSSCVDQASFAYENVGDYLRVTHIETP